jgi:hypothetical protein
MGYIELPAFGKVRHTFFIFTGEGSWHNYSRGNKNRCREQEANLKCQYPSA